MARVDTEEAPTPAQSGGELGGWLLELRATRGAMGRPPAEQRTSASVTSVSKLMLRAMHERVAVINSDASLKRVLQRSASIAHQSVTKARGIEREIATKPSFFAAARRWIEAPRQCASGSIRDVSR